MARLAEFHAAVLALSKEGRLTIQGSWAHNEFHAIEFEGNIQSFSDVDFQCGRDWDPAEEAASLRLLDDAAARCNFKWLGTSFRRASEMRRMYMVGGNGEGASGLEGGESAEFLTFWIYEAAAECLLKITRECPLWEERQVYFANKLFLMIWRDLAIIEGRSPRSYFDLVQFMALRMPEERAMVGLKIKLGMTAAVTLSELRDIHADHLLHAVAPIVKNTVGEVSAAQMLSLEWLTGDAPRPIHDMIETAAGYVGRHPSRAAAVARLRWKAAA